MARMPHLLTIIEIAGYFALLAGLVAIPLGLSLVSDAIAIIFAGIEFLVIGIATIWLMNPELSIRPWRR